MDCPCSGWALIISNPFFFYPFMYWRSAPGPPVNIWFPEVSESSVTIVWEAPDEPNGVISRYKVAWRRADQPNTPVIHEFLYPQGQKCFYIGRYQPIFDV